MSLVVSCRVRDGGANLAKKMEHEEDVGGEVSQQGVVVQVALNERTEVVDGVGQQVRLLVGRQVERQLAPVAQESERHLCTTHAHDTHDTRTRNMTHATHDAVSTGLFSYQ